MQNYKNLMVWEKAHQFVIEIYSETKLFPKVEMFVLTNQIRRAAISIPANIAEGCGKNSQKEFARYLAISLGSAHECEYFVLLAKDLFYIQPEKFSELNKKINEIKAMLIGLIFKINRGQ